MRKDEDNGQLGEHLGENESQWGEIFEEGGKGEMG